jgi:N-succinyldiaminopimelate aminotransferase
MPFLPAHRVANFGTTIFSEMSKLAAEHQAVNLGQGFPDFDGPEAVKEAARAAITAGQNQYAVGIGQPALRQAIAAHAHRFYHQTVNPETEITVTSGATETLFAAIQGLVNPGEEVVVIEPFYDAYVPDITMAGGVPRCVPLRPTASGEWLLDGDELRAAFSNRTRLMLFNTPHNPTGKVFTRAEMDLIAELCQQWNVIAITDEVYEHLTFDGVPHVRLATLPGMAERTLTISSLGKTFSFTGWKIGWSIAPPDLTSAVRRAHQWITFATSTPMQVASTVALNLGDEFFSNFKLDFQQKRDYVLDVLRATGFRVSVPRGTYFIMADFSPLGFQGNDVEFAKWLIREIGVVVIPPSVFFSEAHKPIAYNWARFAFCKKPETLAQAAERLRRLV